MRMACRKTCCILATLAAVLITAGCVERQLRGDSPSESAGRAVHPSVTLQPPQGKTRVIDFETDEGTWMSVDISPDGEWIIFDLLGHVYKIPSKGGDAVSLTENSGGAVNYHPR